MRMMVNSYKHRDLFGRHSYTMFNTELFGIFIESRILRYCDRNICIFSTDYGKVKETKFLQYLIHGSIFWYKYSTHENLYDPK